MVTLYKWQEECLEKWKEVSHRGVIEVTTGGGKTLLASVAATRRIEETEGNIRVYVVVPRVALLDQWRKTLEYVGLDNIAVQTGKEMIPSLISIFTINRARDTLPLLVTDDMAHGRNVLLLLDEFHHYGSTANYHLFDFKHSPSYREGLYSALGLSATAEVRTLNTRLIPAIGPLFYRYTLKSALCDKVVNDFVLFNIAVKLDEEERKKYDEISEKITSLMGVLKSKAPSLLNQKLTIEEYLHKVRATGDEGLINLADTIMAYILERRGVIATAKSRLSAAKTILETVKEEDKILIFTERISQVNELYYLLTEEGYTCTRYTSNMEKEEKKRNLNAFRDGEKRILIACRALDEGLDVPDCTVGIFLANTATRLQRIQRSGRIIRKGHNKLPSLLYYLYCDNTVEDKSFLYQIVDDINIGYAKVLDTGEIYNQKYYERIFALLERLKDEKKNASRRELLPLITYGNIRPEQFRTKEELTALLNSSTDPFFRSYLSLMIILGQVAPYTREEEEEEKNPYLI